MRYAGLLVAAAIVLPLPSAAQSMRATTSGSGPGLHVVVTWPPSAVLSRYNLYRREAGQLAWPATPLHKQPLARVVSCPQIKSVIPPASEEWQRLAKSLGDSTGDFDPCALSTLAAGSPKEEILFFLARARFRIAVVAGLAYDDTTVVQGASYEYELRSVNAVGTETGTVFTGVSVTAGVPSLPSAPPGLTAAAGDSRVLLLWGNEPAAAGFAVLRATSAAGPFVRVNEAGFVAQVKQDLEGKPLPSPSNGFLDIQRWEGPSPVTHEVNGVAVDGPFNGVTYFYKVASLDILGGQGPAGATPVAATPQDKTPPAVPGGVQVTPVDSENQLEIRWNKVELDADGHMEAAPLGGYKLYRYDSQNAPPTSGTPIGGLILAPPAGTAFVTASDPSPDLRPPFGEKTFWYRLEAIDASGNVSPRSVAAGGNLKDITAPAPPQVLSAEGFDDFIRLKWAANSEPDLDGYQVYRSLCHNGVANPCDDDRRNFALAAAGGKEERPNEGRREEEPNKQASKELPCTGAYVLIGTVSRAKAESVGTTVSFEDRTVPKGSPLCYSYWIKAIDKAQNRSGNWPEPDPATEKTVCQRLRDKTPPDPAIISGLLARDDAIRVDWIGPPVQDIRAYHVYRSDRVSGAYKWVGGMTVEPPPSPPQILLQPYGPPALVGCGKMPAVAIDSMSIGSFTDKDASAKKIYWYKVVGIDQSGNEAPLAQAVPISTFTFTTALPPAPVIGSAAGSSTAPVAITVRWGPAFDSNVHRGFAVFRSDEVDGLYRQLGTLLQVSEYQDLNVVRGVTYWYKVVAMDLTGQVSLPSVPASGSLP
jgi:hypothetical protein